MDNVTKAGHQSDDDPFQFILSNEAVDRAGDVIRVKGWVLDEFQANPVALLSHDHSQVIGVWTEVKVVGKQLLGRLKLAAPGTSELIDTTRKLIEQRILKAVSVGFQPLEANPRKGGGYEFTKSILHECSVCAVPMNPTALALAKAAYSEDVVRKLFVKPDAVVGSPSDGQLTATNQLQTPHLDAARTRLKALGIDY